MELDKETHILKEPIFLKEDIFTKKIFFPNRQLVFKKEGIERKYKETIYVNKEIRYKYKDLGLATELILANKELAFQCEEKEKRAAELVIANIELVFQNREKEKRIEELIIANRELAFQKVEMNVRESELLIVNRKLIFKPQERQIKNSRTKLANRDFVKLQQKQKEYIEGLEEMMFMTSHKVRQPIANILGLSNVLDYLVDYPEELKQTLACIKESALTLDLFTRELITFIFELGQKEKNEKEDDNRHDI